MKKSLLIIRSNLRKSRGQTAAMIVLILLSAFMLNLWLMLSMDYKANFDRYHKELNAEHVTLSVDLADDGFQEFLSKTLEEDGRTAELPAGPLYAHGGNLFLQRRREEQLVCLLEKQAALTRSIGRLEIVEEGGFTSGVYLPMLYRTEEIDVGKPIEISIGNQKKPTRFAAFSTA